jgi:hypothetical protein
MGCECYQAVEQEVNRAPMSSQPARVVR